MTNQTIFISHRTKDKAVADMLLDFLATTGIPRDAIKCSSLPVNDVKQQISPEVRTWIAGSAVNIAILSRDYYKSAYCLNEAGILWYLKDVPVIPIALPEIKHEDMIGFLNSDYKLRRLDSEDDIAYIYDTVQEKLEAKQVKHSVITTETAKLKERYRTFCFDRLSAASDSVVKARAGKSRVESDVESGGTSTGESTDDYERWLEEEDLYVDGYHEVHDRDGNVVEKGQYLKGKLVDGISCNNILKISKEKEGVEEREPTAEEAEDFNGYDYEAWEIKQLEDPVLPDEIKGEQWSYYECQRYEAPLMLSHTHQYIASLGIEYFYVVDKKVKLVGKQIMPTFTNFRSLESFLKEHEPDELEYLKSGKWSYEQADCAEVEVPKIPQTSLTRRDRNMQKKVMLVFGTRPEAIKMCPLVNELKKRSTIQTIVCVTAQHRQMLDQVLETFGVVPDYDLNIMKDRQTLFDITTNILNEIRAVLETEKPDVVLVHGDTSTTFVTALACFYLQIPVGHVEAGLRTYNIYSPYPEEFNREAVSIISAYNFAPTPLSRDNLIKEGRKPENIYVTGNTVIDAMQHTVREDYTHPELDWVGDSKLIFITAHRRENLGLPMHHMFRAIRRVLDEHPECKAVYPIHMNPVVREAADAELGGCENIHIIEPIEVFDCHNFEARSFLCLTDSGGIQEECPSYGVPVLVMRNTTERPEGVDAGTLKLVGTDEETIYRTFKMLLENQAEYERMSHACNPYGDGKASVRIADILEGKEYQPWVAG